MVGVVLMGVVVGLDVFFVVVVGVVVFGVYFGDKILLLFDLINFVVIVVDIILFEYIQYLFWMILLSFLFVVVVYFIVGYSNMLGEVVMLQCVMDIIYLLELLYYFNIVFILLLVIVLWGVICKKFVILLMLSVCVFVLFFGVIMQGLSIKQGLDVFIDGFDIVMFL